MTRIVDASVILAVMLGEAGSTDAAAFLHGSIVSTVNASEVYRKLIDGGLTAQDAVDQFGRFQFETVPFDDAQAVETARLRPLTKHLGLSFADRACLALAVRTSLPVFTADRDWAALDLGLDIRIIR